MAKQLEGVVVSAKMDKTVVVQVERTYRHPLYHKIIRRNKRIKAHNETEIIKEGDIVQIVETRPLSKDKHFKIVKKVE
jgi:small subunit ribosomal protein S17